MELQRKKHGHTQNGPIVSLILKEKKPTPYFDTQVKMLWDDKFMYFYTEMQESHIWGNLTERDAVIFYNNDLKFL